MYGRLDLSGAEGKSIRRKESKMKNAMMILDGERELSSRHREIERKDGQGD